MAWMAAWAQALLLAALVVGSSGAAASAIGTQPFPAQDSLQAAAAGVSSSFSNSSAAGLWQRKLQQLPKSPAAQIFLDGILQDASLDPKCADQPTCGGTLTVNNVKVVVPNNAMVFLPANALTWQELFGGAAKTGLALNDPPAPAGVTYTVSVTANRVGNSIIAGLIDITQDALVTGAGYIEAIDYATGELTIEGAAVRINDPTGRYGKKQTAGMDDRFCVDPDNPTIRAATGFPMCVPRTAPADGDDPLCPVKANRPMSGGMPSVSIQMNDPGNNPDPLKMAPLMVGDYVTYAGVLTGSGFFSAYEIVSNVAIYTKPGVDPAYTVFEVAITPTGGLNIAGLQEAATRSRYEGFTTDPTRPVYIWALDFNYKDGTFAKRDLGQVMPDSGPPVGAVRGRWRIQPPCGNTGPLTSADVFVNNKGCVPPAGGIYTPPTREVMVEVWNCTPVPGAANNMTSGDAPAGSGGCMYRSPTIEYLWPENVPGTPIVANNFQTLPFLVRGGYTSGKGTLVGGLDPWPMDTLPADSCKAPTIVISPTLSATAGGNVLLTADVTGPGSPFSYHWQALSPNGGTSANYDLLSATFKNVTADAGSNSTVYTLTVTNSCAFAASSNATVAIGGAGTDQILAIAPTVVKSGTATVNITASLSGAADRLFDWSLPVGLAYKAQMPFANVASTDSTIFFSAPILPDTMTTAQSYVVNVTAGGMAKASAIVTVTPSGSDTVAITNVVFVCAKHRMTITATDSITTAGVKLTLQPYIDNQGKMFDPATLGNTFTNQGAGTHQIVLNSAPLPSMFITSLYATSNLGGASIPVAITQAAVKAGGTCTI